MIADAALSITEHFSGFGQDINTLKKRLRKLANVEVYDAFAPYAVAKRWLNYLPAEEADDAGLQAAYGANYRRLAGLKAQYDPDNVFHLNANIKPE